MYRVQKRNGTFMDFDIRKIANAMTKAFEACDQPVDESIVEMLALKVTSDFAPKVKDNTISVEDIQDSVESILAQAGYMNVAKAYILYRENHTKARNAGEDMLNYKKVVDGYLKIDDWRVKENSTVTYSIGGLILSNSGAITANYWLNEIYDKEIGEAHKNVDMHIHDLSMLSPYCFTGDTRIKTLDGKNYSFKEMVDANMKEVWVFAFDGEKIVPAKAINPRITRRVNQLVKITLTNKQTILVTPDHLFMVRDGSYVPAKDLKPNTSLMPLYIADNPNTKYSTISKVWYKGRGDGYLHRWVAESVLGRALLPNEVVHHLDGDKHNCSPENLQVMDDSEHRRLSVLETMQTDKWKKANNARLVAYNQSEVKRQSISAFAQTRSRSPKGTFTKFAYCGEGAGTPDFNHCVRKVEVVKLTEYIDVYDMTVPQYENFALNAGVFVHNCAGWSLKQLIEKGIGGVPSKITSAPAAHLSTLVNQMVNFLGIMQNEWAG